MPADFRAQLPALANKTYFNNPALPKRSAQIYWAATVLGEGKTSFSYAISLRREEELS